MEKGKRENERNERNERQADRHYSPSVSENFSTSESPNHRSPLSRFGRRRVLCEL